MKLYPILGYEGLYSITKCGKIWSYRRKKFMKIQIGNNGYYRIKLRKGKSQKQHSLHRLLAIIFIPNPKNKLCVNHKDGIKTNNRLSNLEWVTHSENNIHSFKKGLQCKKGENHHANKLTEKDILKIRKLYASKKYTHEKLSKIFNVGRRHIGDIVNRKSWKHI